MAPLATMASASTIDAAIQRKTSGQGVVHAGNKSLQLLTMTNWMILLES